MKKILIRTSLFLLVLLLLSYVGLSWFFSGLIIEPNPEQRKEKTAAIAEINAKGPAYGSTMAALPEKENIEITTDEGVILKGWYFPMSDTAKCAVIMAHGWTSTRTGMLKYTPLFDNCGCDIVMYDHRVHGESEGGNATGGVMEGKDLLKVTDYVQERTGLPDNKIGWVGVSWGGATVLHAGSSGKEVAFILSDAPFDKWHSAIFERAIRDYGSWVNLLTSGVYAAVSWRTDGTNVRAANTAEAARSIKAPVFLFHSKMDEATASWQSENINKNLDPNNSVFHHTEWGGGHGKDITENKDKFIAVWNEFMQQFAPDFCK